MKFPPVDLARWTHHAAVILAFTGTLLLVVPFAPFMVGFVGEDWPYAMNAATAEGLVFGRDIIFTAGPLSAIYTRGYHPATDAFMVGGLLVIGTALFLGLCAITPSRRRPWLLMLPVLLAQFSFEAFMVVALPLLWVMSAESIPASAATRRLAVTYLLGIACALLTLVKGSMTIGVAIGALLTFISLWHRSRAWAMGLIAVCVVTLVATWILVGQPLSALLLYFFSQVPIVSGYSVAMAASGHVWEILVFLALVPILLWTLSEGSVTRRWKILLALTLLLFLAFKASFVRHDAHATIAACAIAIAGFVAFLEKPILSGKAFSGAATGAIGCVVLAMNYQPFDTATVQTRLIEGLETSVVGLKDRMLHPGYLRERFRQEGDKMRAAYPFPKFAGTADIYPQNAAALIASGTAWSPRPTVISYAAYTPSLALANADHLRMHGPDRVYFGIQPIDGRYPALEDGASWPVLLANYVPSGSSREQIHLDRRAVADAVTFGATETSRHPLGEDVDLRGRHGPQWATVQLAPTFAGRIVSAAFKLPQLHLLVRYADGSKKSYAFVPGMAAGGFLLTPTITSGTDFAALQSSRREAMLGSKYPVSVGIYGERGTRWLWQKAFQLTLSDLNVGAVPQAEAFLFDNTQTGDRSTGLDEGGICRVDTINSEVSHPVQVIPAGSVFEIRGWAVLSGPEGKSHDSLQLALEQGEKAIIVATRMQARPDVGANFAHPEMTDSGFFARIDTSGMHGDYNVRILQTHDGKQIACTPATTLTIR